ncbi:hypothetical protein C900_05899 [Fulvivirga imtechensis AK7]|uniref:Signal transduction histidine kinase dimerisation/phosphoacceptor domain-containing protein n=2 Tax=Fulvivirga TaxID=396811 RepID=L8JIK9_9BACT|nr:hypothetical protein C900_05899 [Fulvivirga imtechensis AK7]
MLVYDKMLLLVASEKPEIDFVLDEYISYKAPLVLMWILILLSLGYYMATSKHALNKINSLNAKLLMSNRQVNELNAVLRSNLAEKTQKLYTRNNKLLIYADVISHEIKAPLARIMGLQYLVKNNGYKNKEELDDMLFRLSNEISELCAALSKAEREIELEEQNSETLTTPLTGSKYVA